MRVDDLTPAPGSKKISRRVGRGTGGRRGKTAGRGTKGTGARGTVPAGFEGGQLPLQRRQPKLGGFSNPNRVEYAIINVAKLDEYFEAGDEVTPETLRAKGLIKARGPVKVLGHGDLTKALTVAVDKVSGSAADKIDAAGGTVA